MAKKKLSMASQHESWELSTTEALVPLLRPGESLRIALSGATGWFEGVSLVDLFMALLDVLGGVPTSELNRTTYIGITENDLVYATTKDPMKPSRLQRVSLGNVSIVKFKENHPPILMDVLIIDTGTKRLTLSTGENLRPVIRAFAETLARREADWTYSAGHLQETLTQQVRPIPLHVRLVRPLGSALGDVAATLRVDGPAHASILASRYSFALLAATVGAGFVFIFGTVALASIFPTALWGQLRDILMFILLLPVLLTTLLGVLAALVAAGLAINSTFKRGERPLTVITSFLRSVALLVCYTLAIFGAVLLGGE